MRRTHYVDDFDDAWAVCGAFPDWATDNESDVTCPDCKDELR